MDERKMLMDELIENVTNKLMVIFKYDQTYLPVIKKENLKVTFEYKGDEKELVRMVFKDGDIMVGVTKFEVVTVKMENLEQKTENKLYYENWEELLNV